MVLIKSEIPFVGRVFIQNVQSELFRDTLFHGVDIEGNELTDLVLLTEDFQSLVFRGSTETKEGDVGLVPVSLIPLGSGCPYRLDPRVLSLLIFIER